jgi:S-DNA-T family DNA segregation ATPase FtsK/SpoIIIE
MIFELCYYHAPEDLQFVVFFDREKDWDSIENTINRYKFMPHFRGLFPDKSQFVFDKESAHLVMSSLLTMMNARREKGEGAAVPHVVMIVFDEYGLKEHAFAEYLPKAPEEDAEYINELGLSFVFATKYKEHLPAYCDDVVDFSGNDMTLTPRSNVAQKKRFRYDEWDRSGNPQNFYVTYTQKMTRAMRFFSSVHYAQIAQNGKVPSSVSMFEVVNPNQNPLESLIRSNWGIGQKRALPSVTKSLQVPIGKTEHGLAYLDLHEKADGPHMLVAGTTGSGKTETIISYLLGLCMQYRPEELNLLLVDMKGGGFTKRIGHLPHVVGAVTDVDGDENGTSAEYMLGRFLNAMKSEIKRRKLLFNKLYVDSIDSYIRACGDIESHIAKKKLTGQEAALVRQTAASEPLSHLILVVDEFTELKRFSNENSDIDFMGEITTIARVGRSLGFHIILISQNIEGAITDDIRVNSNARLCLKVATRQASKEMIGTELAASAYMPGNGRAYMLVGTGSKFEYFQSAYSGTGLEEHIPVEISLASKTGAYIPFYNSDRDNLTIQKRLAAQKKSGTAKTQLEAICDAICRTYSACGDQLGAPHTVFSSPLSACIAWDPQHDAVIDLNKRKQVNR